MSDEDYDDRMDAPIEDLQNMQNDIALEASEAIYPEHLQGDRP